MNLEQKRAIALGFFDGVHLGHQALLRRTEERAGERGLSPAVFTFDRSPRQFVTGAAVPLLTTAEERQAAVEALSAIREVLVVPFDQALMTLPWVDFLLMLAQKYRAGWLVAGHDFRFGHQNAGSPALLAKKAASLGMGCDIIPAVTLEGVTVSSTHIRTLLAAGRAEEAARFLGRPFSLEGPVLHGRGIGGARLGTPTVNLAPPPGHLVPAYGVYATRVWVGGAPCPAVTNVGVRPTVEADGTVTVESHLLDQSAQLYGRHCRVEFLEFLRAERKFPSLEALRRQLADDVSAARAYFHLPAAAIPGEAMPAT